MRDIEFTFVGPVVFSASLTPEDIFRWVDGNIVLTFQSNNEVVTLNANHLLYMSERPRTIQRKKRGASGA